MDKERGTDPTYEFSRNNLAWFWSWRSALRSIVKSGEITLFTLDDVLPKYKIGWHEINDLVRECVSYAEVYGKFHLLNFHIFWNMPKSLREPIPESHRIGRGTGGEGGLAMVLSREGAQLLLDRGRIDAYHYPDSICADLVVDGVVDGIWHSSHCQFAHIDWDGDREI